MTYAIRVAERFGWQSPEIDALRFGAILHDIGKIYIHESILSKAGPLTQEEWAEMKQHPVIGAELLKGIPYLSEVIPVIRSHHERWDGLGYPDGLSGEAIPMGARIVAIADCFDAMTTDRIYHAASSPEQALAEIRKGAGNRYDPAVVEAFLLLKNDA
jgi:putative nucleotidyltransferase with HDIG domain